MGGLFILRVMLEEVFSHIVDGIFRLILFLSQRGKCLQHKGNDGLVEVGANWDGFEAILGGLHRRRLTWLIVM